MTGDFPRTKGGMLVLLTEYRHALYDVAAEHAENMDARKGLHGARDE